jgi:hypothetical protein
MLLLLIANSQQRIELGLPSPEGADSAIDIPKFTPSMKARWINGIWFTSLALSLSAALVAMLGKEWLTAFLTSRPRPVHSHALIRQSRLEGLERWWALHILALLPSLLHASLLLFSIGLVLYLWMLDPAIASVIAGVVGATSLFYAVTAVLGAVYDFCPYVTEISGYIRRATIALLGHQRKEAEVTCRASVKDLQALLWLANNARDPAVVDCAYQALAGLHRSVDKHQSHSAQSENTDASSTNAKTCDLPMQLDPYTTISSLLSTVADRFERLSSNQIQLAAGGGISAARYARAMLGMVVHLQRPSFEPLEGYISESHRPGDTSPEEKDQTYAITKPESRVSNFYSCTLFAR